MTDIILLALESEAPSLFEYDNVFCVGVGKVNAAITTMHLLHTIKPDRVINLGTAGGITLSSGIHRVNTIVQHDVNLTPLGLNIGDQLNDPLNIIQLSGAGVVCASGDVFVSDRDKLRIVCDVVEMEAYSIAKACRLTGIEVEIWKYISDSADGSAGKSGKIKYLLVKNSIGKC